MRGKEQRGDENMGREGGGDEREREGWEEEMTHVSVNPKAISSISFSSSSGGGSIS